MTVTIKKRGIEISVANEGDEFTIETEGPYSEYVCIYLSAEEFLDLVGPFIGMAVSGRVIE